MPRNRGFTIIEVVVTTFIIGVVVTGLFGLFLLSIRSSQENERRVVAVALANERMEMIRNLPYLSVGTSGGVPSGSIAQNEVVTRNNLEYTVKTDIRYVDDPYDGQAPGTNQNEERVTVCHKPGTLAEASLEISASALDAHIAHGDTTGACGSGVNDGTGAGDDYNTDYKQAKVEVSWNGPDNPSPVLLLTIIAPQGVEGAEAGGTLDFLALSAAGDGIPSADVTITNDTVSPAVNIATQTNSEGHVVLPGLPEAVDSYKLSVSKTGYTSEQTYDETPTFIPDTDHSNLSMIQKEVTNKVFSIDQVSSITLTTKDDTGAILPSIAYTIQGTKTIGTDNNGSPVYVLQESASTDTGGQNQHTDLVWDSYNISIDGDATGYDIKESSEFLPLALSPGQDANIDIVLVPHTPLSLHVSVPDSTTGDPVDNATVHVTGPNSYDESLGTGAYGQVFFNDLVDTGQYTVEITAPGYDIVTQDVQIDASQRIAIELSPSA